MLKPRSCGVELSSAFEAQGAELEAERGQHGRTRDSLTAVSTELVTVKARAEAAKLAGQAAALTAQQAELMRVIEGRDGARPAPKGGKK